MTSEVASACDVLPGPGPHPLAGWRLQRDVGEPQARCRRRRRQDLAGGKVKPPCTQGTRAPGMTGDGSRSSTWLSVVTGTPRFWIRCGRSRRSHSETRLGRVRPLLRDARAAGDAGGRRDGRPRCELRRTGPATVLGHNLDDDASCGLQGAGDLWGGDPRLGPLQDNGGPAPTLALLEGSAAIDAGGSCPPPAVDQPGGLAGRRDISAFEAAPPPPDAPACGTCAFACGRRRVSVKHPRVSSDRSCGSSERPIPSMYAAAAYRHLAGP
jgi:hypothetical protein